MLHYNFLFDAGRSNRGQQRQWLTASQYKVMRSLPVRLKKQVACQQFCAGEIQLVPAPPCADTARPVGSESNFASSPILSEVFNYINENYNQPIDLGDVARAVGYAPAHLTNLVGRQTGKTIHQWIVDRRMAAVRSLLLETNQSVEEIAAAVGYFNPSNFYRQFRQFHGMSPRAWRKKHRS